MNQFLHQPGFLGTNANRAVDLTLVLMLLAAALFTFGFVLARQRRYRAHRWVQTSAATLNAAMVLWMMVLPYYDFVIKDFLGSQRPAFYTVTSLHAAAGLAAFTFGVFVTLRGNELVPKALKFNNYKRYMRIAYGLYMFATLLGIWVYFVWWVNNPTPPQF